MTINQINNRLRKNKDFLPPMIMLYMSLGWFFIWLYQGSRNFENFLIGLVITILLSITIIMTMFMFENKD